MSDETRQKISKSQRDRYQRERDEAARTRGTLHAFVLWWSPVWDANNEDDVAAALSTVDQFLREQP